MRVKLPTHISIIPAGLLRKIVLNGFSEPIFLLSVLMSVKLRTLLTIGFHDSRFIHAMLFIHNFQMKLKE